jgi:hypothetical protein
MALGRSGGIGIGQRHDGSLTARGQETVERLTNG